jgi:hypothetical protein
MKCPRCRLFKPSGFINGREFDQLIEYLLHKKDPVAWILIH